MTNQNDKQTKTLNDVQLVKQVVQRDGKTYLDYYLVWFHNDKFVSVRIRPCFKDGHKPLYANSKDVPLGEDLQKYM